MSEFSGQVTHVEWSLTPLWLIPLLPFLGAVINAIFGRRLQRSEFGRETSKRLHIGSFGVSAVAVAAMLGAFALVVANFVKLVSLEPGHRYLYSHAWQMLRIGSLDVNFSEVFVGNLPSDYKYSISAYSDAFRNENFGAVPEPATWAMMIFGFGLVGGALRSAMRKQKLAVSFA